MAEGRCGPAIPAALAWVLTAALAPPAVADDKPKDDRVVCVPAEDGRNWVCGTPDNPPEVRPVQRKTTPAPSTSAPPIFLMDPNRRASGPAPMRPNAPARGPAPDLPTPNRPAPDPAPTPVQAAPTPIAPTPPEPAPPTRPAPPVEATTAPATEPARAEPAQPAPVPEPAESEPPKPAPVTAEAAPEPRKPEPVAEQARPEPAKPEPAKPEPAKPEPARPEPASPEPAKPEPAKPEPAPEPAKPEPPKPAPPPEPAKAEQVAGARAGATLRDAPAFLALKPERYTIQLARAERPDGFEALAEQLGLQRGELYAVPWRVGGTRTWLLFWGEFEDEASAQAAVARLSGHERLGGAWPRRMRAMQEELRHGGAATERQP